MHLTACNQLTYVQKAGMLVNIGCPYMSVSAFNHVSAEPYRPDMAQVQKAQVTVKRQPSMTDRMLVGQKLNSKELRDNDVRRQVLLQDTPHPIDIQP